MFWKTGCNCLPDAWEKQTGNIERGFCYDRNIPICKGGKGSAVIEKKLELEQYIEIVFSYNTETSLEEFMLDYKKIEMLITIGSGIIPYRRKTCFYDKRNYFHPERKDIAMPKEIYVGDKPYSKGDEITNFDMLFTLDDIDEKNRNAYFDTTQSDENISYIVLKSRLVDLMNDDFRLSLFPLFIGGILPFTTNFTTNR